MAFVGEIRVSIVIGLAGEVLLAWRMAGNLNYRQARQEVSPGNLMSFLPGLHVIQISRHP